MNSLKLSIFALSMSFSMGAMAASTMDSTTGAEDSTNRSNSNSNNSNQARDCSIRNGNDKLLCEKEMQNDADRATPNDNSRINRGNDGNMIDDRKARDLQSRDRELNNSQRNDSLPNDSQPRDTTPRNSNPSSSGSDGSGTGTLNAL